TAINERRCQPPLPSREVETVARGCANYEIQPDRFPLAAMDRLWKAEAEGGDAVTTVIEEIERVTGGFRDTARSTADVARLGFQQVDTELQRLKATAADPTAIDTLITQCHAAADAGVTDFSFMAESIDKI